MQSHPNRERVIRAGRHCAQCSPYLIRVPSGNKVKAYQAAGKRIGNPRSRGRAKAKGIHAYRLGLVKIRPDSKPPAAAWPPAIASCFAAQERRRRIVCEPSVRHRDQS